MVRLITFDISDLNKEILLSKGIYKILNTKTKDFYIGSASRTFNERFKEHCRYYEQYLLGQLKRKHNPILWSAFKKYGIQNFKIEIIEIINDNNIILKREEFYINTLNPKYNICKTPSNGGSPNKNIKLTNEWKENIRKKSKLYKHSKETLEIVTNNNKNNAVKLKFISDNEELNFNSWVEAESYFGMSSSAIKISYQRTGKWKKYNIVKLTNQSKKIKANDIIFNSFNECDRYFNMWRGYTSTCIKFNNLLLDKYTYELI